MIPLMIVISLFIWIKDRKQQIGINALFNETAQKQLKWMKLVFNTMFYRVC